MYTDKMQLIACVNDNWAIGKDGKLLYDIPADKMHFRAITMDHVVVMGRKTYDSLPDSKYLKGRENIILTRSGLMAPGFIVVHDVAEAFSFFDYLSDKPAFVIGGEQIYREFLPYCNTAHITHVKDDAAGDTHLPNLRMDLDWILTSYTDWVTEKDRSGKSYEIRYETYMRMESFEQVHENRGT